MDVRDTIVSVLSVDAITSADSLTLSRIMEVCHLCDFQWSTQGHLSNPFSTKDPEFIVWACHSLLICEQLHPVEGEFEKLPPAPMAEYINGDMTDVH